MFAARHSDTFRQAQGPLSASNKPQYILEHGKI